MDESAAAQTKSAAFDYQDIRDDRIYTYFDLQRGKTKTFEVIVTATYPGRFYLPGQGAEPCTSKVFRPAAPDNGLQLAGRGKVLKRKVANLIN